MAAYLLLLLLLAAAARALRAYCCLRALPATPHRRRLRNTFTHAHRALPSPCCTQTEPPLNPPENREYTAEVMFETFNVPGLHIGVQAVLALTAALAGTSSADRSLTGTVIDSGDGGTHIIPVSDGYVIGGAIRHIPLAGKDITAFVQRALRERGEPVPPEDSMELARRIKEEHWCVCL